MTLSNEIETMIQELEGLASEVLDLKRTSIPRRPIVIEFCGSPKAGKTSCINALAMFLRRNDFRVRVTVERAGICPIKNKFDPSFNIWTVSSAIAELSEILSNASKDYDVIILDRGIFDALCWFEWQHDNRYLNKETLEKTTAFLTMTRWRSAIDLVLAFVTNSEVSIEREYASLLTRKRGSIMREPILDGYKSSIQKTVDIYGKNFRKVEIFDTSNTGQNEVSYQVTKKILNILRDTTAEAVGCIPLSKFIDIDFEDIIEFSFDRLPKGDCVEFSPRPIVEANILAVQPIPIVVITDKKRQTVLCARKNRKAATEQSPEHNKTLIYFGGHTRFEDSFATGKTDVLSVCNAALTRELKEEIGVDFCPEDNLPSYLIWMKDNERSKKHLAVCYVWETDPESLQIRFDKNEFSITQNNNAVFLKIGEVLSEPLESWSKSILRKVFSAYVEQGSLPLKFD